MRTVKRDVVAILLFSKDGKLFQGMRDPAHGGVWPDCWNIPGGGVDEGEGKEDAVRRETLEETGVDISGYPLELVDDAGSGVTEKTLRETGGRVIVSIAGYFWMHRYKRLPFTPWILRLRGKIRIPPRAD